MRHTRWLLALSVCVPAGLWAGIIGEPAETPLQLPYSQTFDDASSMSDFTILDENNDGIYWKWDNNEAGCSQNPNKAMDDWLIMRPVYLKANTDYFFSMNARRYRASDKERFEVYMGTSATPADMTVEIIPPTEPPSAYKELYDKTIRVNADGYYYIGIHGISDKWKTRMVVDDISLRSGASDAAPAKPVQFSVTPDADGELSALISFVTPSLTVTGEPVASLSMARIFRDDSEIHTIPNPSVNSLIEWTDNDVAAGYHTYEVAVDNGAGIGDKARFDVYVGLYRPRYPENVVLAETGNYGQVKLTWDAPATDQNGNPLDPSKIRYRVVEATADASVTVAEDIRGCEYIFQAVEPGAVQEFKDYLVYASTNGGENNIPTRSNTVAVGQPFALPYMESFNTDNGASATPMASQTLNGAVMWYWYDDGEYALGDIRSQDGDNGYISMYGQTVNYSGRIFTAKIDLAGSGHPVMSFYAYKMAADDNNELSFEVAQNGVFSTVSTVSLSDYPGTGWVKIMLPMTRYKGRVVQFGIKATTITDAYTPIDRLQIFDMPRKDATLSAMTIPATVKPNEKFAAKVEVENNGYDDLTGLKVELLHNGEVEAAYGPFDLASCTTAWANFPLSLSSLEAGEHTYSTRVVCEGDNLPENNLSGDYTVTLQPFGFPVVDDFAGETAPDGVAELHWTAPDGSAYEPPQVTEDFEKYPAFINANVGDWLFYDGDGGNIGGIGSGDNALDFPGISGPQSWWVMDAGYSEIPNVGYVEFWKAHSGSKYLMQEYAVNQEGTQYVKCDDWIISPELNGKSQTISFWCKAYNKNYNETFTFLTSMTDENPASFTPQEYGGGFGDEWTEFRYTVPDGTRFFAIACTSRGALSMFVDDITYTPGGESVIPVLKGFNVYRDGFLATPQPVCTGAKAGDVCTFRDVEGTPGNHRYVVTAVYDKGESSPSGEVMLERSGVEAVSADMLTDARYFNLQGIEILHPVPGQICIEVRGSSARKVCISR